MMDRDYRCVNSGAACSPSLSIPKLRTGAGGAKDILYDRFEHRKASPGSVMELGSSDTGCAVVLELQQAGDVTRHQPRLILHPR